MEKKELHVLYIITKLELGGAQKVCLSLFDGLHAKGNTVFLISGNQGSLAHQVHNKKNVHLLSEFKREISLRSALDELKNFFDLIQHIRTIKKQHPNLIVHTHSTKAGLLGRWAAFFAGVSKRLHTVHGYHFHSHQPWLIWLISYFLEFFTSLITTHYICVSSTDAQEGKKLLPFFSKKHSLIRAAVDWQQFYLPARTTHMDNTNIFIVGTVACFKKQKNLVELLQAFEYAFMHNSLIRLEIIGDGVLRPQLETWIKEHELAHVITLHGWQSHVAPLMQRWQAFALTSLWEGLPCAIIEARLMKLPVLAYNTGGIKEVISHGNNGFLYHHHDWKQLAHHLIELSTNQALYTQLSNYNEDLTDFSDQAMIDKHISMYQQLRN